MYLGELLVLHLNSTISQAPVRMIMIPTTNSVLPSSIDQVTVEDLEMHPMSMDVTPRLQTPLHKLAPFQGCPPLR